jgi:hypothetical protein
MQVTLEKLFYFAKLPLEVDCLVNVFLRCTTKDEKCQILIAIFFSSLYFDLHQN